MKLQKNSKWLILLLFAVLTLIGLAVSPRYGTPIDEATEQAILRSNIKEYAFHLLDESHPFAVELSKSDDPLISQSIECDHGQCVYYPAALLLWLLKDQPLLLTRIWHIYTFVWFMLGVYAVYAFCRNTGLTRITSFLGAMLIYLSPRFFAEGHYNSKDIILLSLFLLTLWSGIRFMRNPTIAKALLFSLIGAMCTNTRIIGILPWGLMGLFFIVYLSASHSWSKKMIGLACLTVFSFLLFFWLITPAAWSGVWKYLRYVLLESGSFSRWNGVVLYRGQMYNHQTNPLPASYLVYMILVTLPLYTLPLAAIGGIRMIEEFFRDPQKAVSDPKWLSLCAAAVCTVLPLIYAVLSKANLYNGWRHVYFTYSGIVLLGAHGIAAIRNFLRRHGGIYGMHHVFALGLGLYMAFTGFDMARNLPNEFCYYNLIAHETAQENLELDYWCVSTQEAVDKLASVQRNEALPPQVGAYDDISRIALKQCYKPSQDSGIVLETEAMDTPYLLYNPTYAKIYGLEYPQDYHEVYRVNSYGLTVCILLEKD